MSGNRAPRRRRVWVAVGAVASVVALGAGWSLSTRAATAAPVALDCTPAAVEYGQPITCQVTAAADTTIDWGDGTDQAVMDGGSMDHVAAGVGAIDVSLLDPTRLVLATASVNVAPDLDITCVASGDELPIYQLTAAEGDLPWNYVLDGTDPVQIGSAPRTTRCEIESAALDDLGGSASWSIDSEFYEPYDLPLRNVVPTAKGRWDGLQPGEMVATIDVAGEVASERVGVYFGGCT